MKNLEEYYNKVPLIQKSTSYEIRCKQFGKFLLTEKMFYENKNYDFKLSIQIL